MAHIKEKSAKSRKGIGLLKQLRPYLPIKSLDQIYKMHVRPHLDYCDFIYHIPPYQISDNFDTNLNFKMKALESLQYQAALAITGTWQGTNRDKLYEELGWESLQNRRMFRRLTQFYKIMHGMTPTYLVNHVPKPRQNLYGFRSTNAIPPLFCRTERFQKSFYPDAITCWNNIGPEFRDIRTLKLFKTNVLKIIRPEKKSIFNIHIPLGIKFIYQLRVELSALKSHKKAHNFLDTFDDNCSCSNGSENTVHFLLKCFHFVNHRVKLLNTVLPIILNHYNLELLGESNLVTILLYGDKKFTINENQKILKATISFILSSKRFTEIGLE